MENGSKDKLTENSLCSVNETYWAENSNKVDAELQHYELHSLEC